MENITYEKSLSEVYKVVISLDCVELKKIPEKFLAFLENNMDKEYFEKFEIKGDNLDEQLSKEAKKIIACIYRDFLLSKKEKEKLIQEELKAKKELQEKYSVDNLYKKFNNKNSEINEENINNQLVEIKEQSIIMKIWKKFLSFFKKKVN